MKTIQYECRPGQLRSTIYQIVIFINEDNRSLLGQVRNLTYDPDFSEYNKYQFFRPLITIISEYNDPLSR